MSQEVPRTSAGVEGLDLSDLPSDELVERTLNTSEGINDPGGILHDLVDGPDAPMADPEYEGGSAPEEYVQHLREVVRRAVRTFNLTATDLFGDQ